jgi:hypothetical protein
MQPVGTVPVEMAMAETVSVEMEWVAADKPECQHEKTET